MQSTRSSMNLRSKTAELNFINYKHAIYAIAH